MKTIRGWIERNHFLLLIIFLEVLSIFYSTLSILRHNHFESGGFDLGLYDQAVWKFANFLDPYNTVKERNIFGDHLVLTLPVLGSLFYLWDNVRTLLIAQAFMITFSAVPMYFIAKKRLKSEISAVIIAVLYSLFYGVQYGVYFDFHPIVAIGVPLLAWLAYFWEFGKHRLFWITLVLTLLTQENMGIGVACLSAIFFFRKEFRKQAIVVGSIGIVSSILATQIVARFSPIGYQYIPEFESWWQFFDNAEKRSVFLYSYSWFSFLPLFSPGSLIAVFMDLSQYFITGFAFHQMWTPFKHHRAILDIFLTLGTIDVLVHMRRKVLVCIFLLAVAGFCQYYFHFALNKLAKPAYWKEERWMQDNRNLIALVPKDASVATQQNFVPHLSHRNEIYLLWPRQHDIEGAPCGQSLCWWLDFGGNPEYLIVDTRPNQWLTQTLESSENWLSAIANMEKTNAIVLEKQVGDAKLFKILYTKIH